MLLLQITVAAHAFVYVGNPPLTLQVVREEGDLSSGSVEVTGVRVHRCGGGYTDYPIDELVDPTEPQTLVIAGGDLCAVSVGWSTDLVVASAAFEVRYEHAWTTVLLTGAARDEAELAPLVVDSGTFTGSEPALRVTITD